MLAYLLTRVPPGVTIKVLARKDRALAAELIKAAVAEKGSYRLAAEAIGCTRGTLNWAITDLGIRPDLAKARGEAIADGKGQADEAENLRREYIASLRAAGCSWRKVDGEVGNVYGCSREAALQWRRRRGIGGKDGTNG